MPQATTTRVRMSTIREVTPGVTPTASPRYLPVRFNGESLAGKPKTITSDEITPDRMVADLILVGKDTDGGVDSEYSYHKNEVGGLDQWIEGALANAWVTTPECDNNTVVGNCGNIAAATSYPVTGGGTWAQDMLVRATGYTTAANNKIFAAGAASSSTSIVTTGLTIESAPATARVKCIGLQARAAADIQSTTSGGNRITSSTTTSFATLGLVAGMWIYVGSSAATPDAFQLASWKGWCRISIVAAAALTLDIVPTGFATDTAAGKTVRIFFGDYVRNGTTVFYHTNEMFHADVTQYQYFKGCVVDTMGLELGIQGLLKASFGFKGMDYESRVTQIGTTPSNPAAPTEDVLNASSHVATIMENNTPITGSPGNYVTSLTLNVNNNARQLGAVGVLGFIGINMGRQVITGDLKTYFADATILNKALNNTATALNFIATDSLGNSFVHDLPKVKLASAQAPAGGLDAEVPVDCTYQALKYTNLALASYQMHMQRCELVGTSA